MFCSIQFEKEKKVTRPNPEAGPVARRMVCCISWQRKDVLALLYVSPVENFPTPLTQLRCVKVRAPRDVGEKERKKRKKVAFGAGGISVPLTIEYLLHTHSDDARRMHEPAFSSIPSLPTLKMCFSHDGPERK